MTTGAIESSWGILRKKMEFSMARIKVEKVTDKPAVARRAGTPLTPGSKRAVYGPGYNGKGQKSHGTLDTAQRLYQTGGERDDFVYRRLNLVSMSYVIWQQIRGHVDAIEFIDHITNTCYRLSGQDRLRSGLALYNAGFGQRAGWPLPWFDVIDGKGEILSHSKAPVIAPLPRP
jgi:hypothetical protein